MVKIGKRLNPFENQVYFYEEKKLIRIGYYVLIPLRIRSISTGHNFAEKEKEFSDVLIPLRIRSISTGKYEAQFQIGYRGCLNPFENQVYFYAMVAPC